MTSGTWLDYLILGYPAAMKQLLKSLQQFLRVFGKRFEFFSQKTDLYIEENLKSNFNRSFC